jgi:hypothetical protein
VGAPAAATTAQLGQSFPPARARPDPTHVCSTQQPTTRCGMTGPSKTAAASWRCLSSMADRRPAGVRGVQRVLGRCFSASSRTAYTFAQRVVLLLVPTGVARRLRLVANMTRILVVDDDPGVRTVVS